MAHQPVGAGFSFATNQTSASQTFTVQSDTLRVVAKNAGQHVAIGTTGPATTTDYYVPANSSATLNLGRVSSIGVAGITKGAATVITLPEGMGNPFKVNDVIVISGVTGVTGITGVSVSVIFFIIFRGDIFLDACKCKERLSLIHI